jgi:hypothetical protein
VPCGPGFRYHGLTLALKEVYGLLIQGQIGNLVIEEELDLTISEGTVFYSEVPFNNSGSAATVF